MKKGLKILISVVVIVIAFWSIIFAIDYFRVSDFKKPIFIISSINENDGIIYKGLGYIVKAEGASLGEKEEQITKIEMYIFNKFIVGAVASINDNGIEYNTINDENINNEYKSFRAIVVKSNLKAIEVEPIKDNDRKILSDKVSINLGENDDMLYMEGSEVLISYKGNIIETYPTQINVTNIQLEEQYKTKIEKLPKDYSLIEAIRDNCVINIHGGTIYNKDELDRFVDNVNNNRFDFMRCIDYTIEGDMIIKDVKYEGSNSFRVCVDTTRDRFAGNENRAYKYYRYSKFDMEKTDTYTGYYVYKPLEGELEELYIVGYSNDAKVINDYDVNYLLTPALSNKLKKEKITVGKLDDMYDYDIYYYGFDDVKIDINNMKINLKEALTSKTITMEQIIDQAKKDSENGIIYSEMFKDGGTTIYFYKKYTIIKANTLDDNKNVYIGIPQMKYDVIN